MILGYFNEQIMILTELSSSSDSSSESEDDEDDEEEDFDYEPANEVEVVNA